MPDFPAAIDHSASAILRKTVSARRQKSEPGLAFHARRERYPEKLPAVAVGNFGQFLPSQTQPVVPRLTHAVARGKITLIQLVAFDDLCDRGFN
jgi:hypothetical protein